MFTTEYVIYSNFGLEGEDRDLEAFQLSSYLLDLLGIRNGVLFRYHSYYGSDTDDADPMSLEYDILYGGNYSGSVSEKTEMAFGIDKITVSSVSTVGDILYVRGSGFTEHSVVFIGEYPMNTAYVSSGILMATGIVPGMDSYIEVRQVADDGYIFE